MFAVCFIQPLCYADEVSSDIIQLHDSWNTEYKEYVFEKSLSNGIDPYVVFGIIYNESRYQEDVTNLNTNGTTDYGLMQINEVNFDYLHNTIGIESMNDLLDPYKNIECGIELLRYHTDLANDTKLGLIGYQSGAGTMARLIQKGIYETEVQQQVLDYAEVYRKEYIETNDNICPC